MSDRPDSFEERKRALLFEVKRQMAEAMDRAAELRESRQRLEDTLASFTAERPDPPPSPLGAAARRRSRVLREP